jgi:spermidine synthase
MQHVLWEGDTAHGHYQVVDTPYDGRPARVLYSGDRRAAQSGVAQDDNPDLLFDYNQRLFELVNGLAPSRLLLIGGGVFTLPAALLPALPELRIDAVEPDAQLTELAYAYFDLPVDDRLTIFNTDGRSFLREHGGRYDMVVVDAFSHTTIPKEIITRQAFRAYAKHLASGGVLAMNVISAYHGPQAHVLARAYAAACETFGAVDTFLASRGYSLWLTQNFILTAQAGQRVPLAKYMRYEAVKPSQVEPGVALED